DAGLFLRDRPADRRAVGHARASEEGRAGCPGGGGLRRLRFPGGGGWPASVRRGRPPVEGPRARRVGRPGRYASHPGGGSRRCPPRGTSASAGRLRHLRRSRGGSHPSSDIPRAPGEGPDDYSGQPGCVAAAGAKSNPRGGAPVISRFFIDRPIFATVLSLIITLAGALALLALPITQYPEITPPTIEVSTIYPGANAQLVRDTVAEPIEQQISGVENAMYLSSQCTNDGRYRLLITFKPGTDLNIAQVVTQVRVSLALPILPDLVQREGVSVLKKSPAQMMI